MRDLSLTETTRRIEVHSEIYSRRRRWPEEEALAPTNDKLIYEFRISDELSDGGVQSQKSGESGLP